MLSKIYYYVIVTLFLYENTSCYIRNAAIGILGESNIYVGHVCEMNYTNDNFYSIYQHNEPIYPLQTFTTYNRFRSLYLCSPRTIYTFDLKFQSNIVPLLPIDETPCRSNLIHIANETKLIWTLRHQVIQIDLEDMLKELLWNSTYTIIDMTYDYTDPDDNIDFFLSVSTGEHKSSILRCQTNSQHRIYPFENCYFIDTGFHYISALVIDNNQLYVADRLAQKLYVLSLSPNGQVFQKSILPLNTSIVSDIQSMFIYQDYLYWLTKSGHVRVLSLITYKVRYIFWFDEPLRTIRLISFNQWPNQTTTTTTTIRTSISTLTDQHQNITTTQSINDNNYNSWKASTFVTSIALGIALFLCAALIACVLLNNRLGRVVPHSFTNVFHVLLHRQSRASSHVPISEELLT